MEYMMPEGKHMDEQRLDKVLLTKGLVKPPLDYRLDEIEQNICVIANALNTVISTINDIGSKLDSKGLI